MKNACIVVPIHQTPITVFEQISMDQCFKVLGQYDIYFVVPKVLEPEIQKNKYIQSKKAQYKTFEDAFFKDLPGYNKLMKSPGFYKTFFGYKFMLVYQLDAFVFRDDLSYWCSQDYDYIGAPLFEGYDLANADSPMVGQGNGGFSLRNIQSCYQTVTRFKKLSFKNPYFDIHKPFYINLYRQLKYQVLYNYSKYPFQPVINEDLFWATLIPEVFKNFKVPPTSAAIPFSFEVNPEVLFRKNKNQLPFGCHAWWKYNLDFWKDHIKAYGYEL